MQPEERLVILLNDNVKMSRGKAAAQAVHAALMAYGIAHGPVVVLGGSKRELSEMPIQVCDAGRTEVEPGTLTAAAKIEGVSYDAVGGQPGGPGGELPDWVSDLVGSLPPGATVTIT